MCPDRKTTTWLSAAGLILLGGVAVVFLLVNTPRSSSEESPAVPPAPAALVTTSLTSETINVQSEEHIPPPTVDDLPKLTPVDYPPGSVGDACGVNNFPRRYHSDALINLYQYRTGKIMTSIDDYFRWSGFSSKFNPIDFGPFHWNPLEIEISQIALKNEPCRTALEQHVNQINPYLWGRENDESFNDRALSFTVIDNPMTFERIFTDPKGDLARVQAALARPECQLTEKAESNWQLNETCHAAAFHNAARVMGVCYKRFTNDYDRSDPKNLSPNERDHTMWIHSLEYHWVKEKCNSLDPMYAELRKQIVRQLVNDGDRTEDDVRLDEELTKLAARLGDDAAGLTGMGSSEGRFAGWFEPSRNDPANLLYKHPPSVERLRRFMALFTENQTATDKTFVYDQEALVQHLCTPPYYTAPWVDEDTVPEPPTCRSVIDDLRQELHDNQTFLDLIATFEDVAMRLDVYE
ncbi:MAG: hypothetical protein F4039_04750 [Gammaproteobacteria bacterium]|nr:hypothetical protein [Gammaproteobacteria bacterium]